jgi:Protein of unknown function (DUF4199)
MILRMSDGLPDLRIDLTFKVYPMNTYLTYGAVYAFSNLLLSVILYILGFHSDPAKLASVNSLTSIASIAICACTVYLGQKATAQKVASDQPFGFSQAFLAGFLISVVAGVVGILTNYAYMVYINPQFKEIIIQYQLDKLAARGVSGTALDNAEKGIRMFMKPMMQSIFAVFGTISIGSLASLVTAFFTKRPLKK